MKTFTLPDLIDPKNLLEWLNQDAPPLTVVLWTYDARSYGMGRHGKSETKPVVDEKTLGQWWSDYRSLLAKDFLTSANNRHKKQTDKQFKAECLSASGIKGGTVADRVQRAIAARPDLYRSAAQIEAEREAFLAEEEANRARRRAAAVAAAEAEAVAVAVAVAAAECEPLPAAPVSLVAQELANRARNKLFAAVRRRARQSA